MLFVGQRILLSNLCFSKVLKILENKKYLVEFFDNKNKHHYIVISEEDIISNEQYEILKNRNNLINKILKYKI